MSKVANSFSLFSLRQRLRRAINSPAGGRSRSALTVGFWPAILLGTLSLPDIGAAATVRIRLETTDLNSNVVSTVNVGEQFLLRGYVTDLRANAQGLFASYLNVDYAPGSSVTVNGAVTFTPRSRMGRRPTPPTLAQFKDSAHSRALLRREQAKSRNSTCGFGPARPAQ